MHASSKFFREKNGTPSWREENAENTSSRLQWATVIAIVICSGPFAIVGALLDMGQLGIGILGVAVFGPTVEEVLKVALVLWVVEKRPFLFASRIQVLCCGIAGGLAFAIIENLIYLNVYIAEPNADIIFWRWTVCVALHTGCSLLAAWGIANEWARSNVEGVKPEMSRIYPALLAAVCVHGLYNGIVTLMSFTGYGF